jgi:hypothetical protein
MKKTYLVLALGLIINLLNGTATQDLSDMQSVLDQVKLDLKTLGVKKSLSTYLPKLQSGVETLSLQLENLKINLEPGGEEVQKTLAHILPTEFEKLREKLKICGSSMEKLLKELFIKSTLKSDLGLDWCACPLAPTDQRLLLILNQLNEIAALNPQPTTPIVHVEFGEEGCLQTYLLVLGLIKIGYKKINVILINTQNFPQFDNFTKETKNLNTKEKTDIKVKVYSKGCSEYIKEVQKATSKNQLRAHSFGMVDPVVYSTFLAFVKKQDTGIDIKNAEPEKTAGANIKKTNLFECFKQGKPPVIIKLFQNYLPIANPLTPEFNAVITYQNDSVYNKKLALEKIFRSLLGINSIVIKENSLLTQNEDFLSVIKNTRINNTPVVYTLIENKIIKYSIEDALKIINENFKSYINPYYLDMETLQQKFTKDKRWKFIMQILKELYPQEEQLLSEVKKYEEHFKKQETIEFLIDSLNHVITRLNLDLKPVVLRSDNIKNVLEILSQPGWVLVKEEKK